MPSRRARPLVLAALTMLAVAACGGSSGGPGWTYAPAPSVTAAPSGEPSASPAASAEPSASPAASEAPSGSPAGSPGGGEAIEVTAVNIEFEQKELTTAADAPFTIHFVNNDPPGVPHDVVIRDSGGQDLQTQEAIDGGEEVTYEYTPLAAGTYTFICSIHPIPAMTGTLTVE